MRSLPAAGWTHATSKHLPNIARAWTAREFSAF